VLSPPLLNVEAQVQSGVIHVGVLAGEVAPKFSLSKTKAFTLNKVLKSSRVINRINVELKTNVSEISSVSIIRVDVVIDIYTGVIKQCLFPQEEGGIRWHGTPITRGINLPNWYKYQ
jgi:hypothetical protein